MPTLLTKFEKNFEDISNMCVYFSFTLNKHDRLVNENLKFDHN